MRMAGMSATYRPDSSGVVPFYLFSLRTHEIWLPFRQAGEFFYQTGNSTPNFDKMVGNPICRQIPWSDNPELLVCGEYSSSLARIPAFKWHSTVRAVMLSWKGTLKYRAVHYTVGVVIPKLHRMSLLGLQAAWQEGRTGYPFVDAAMTQLKQWCVRKACLGIVFLLFRLQTRAPVIAI